MMNWLIIKFVGCLTCAVNNRKLYTWKRKELPRIPAVVWMRNIIPQFTLMVNKASISRRELWVSCIWIREIWWWIVTYGGLNEKIPRDLQHLNNFYRDGGTVYDIMILQGMMPHWRMAILGRRKEDLSVESLAPYSVIFLVCFIFQSLVAPLQFFHCFVISPDIIDYLYGAIRKKQIPLISMLCLVIIFITASDKASIVNSSRNVPFIKKCLSWKLTLADPF